MDDESKVVAVLIVSLFVFLSLVVGAIAWIDARRRYEMAECVKHHTPSECAVLEIRR